MVIGLEEIRSYRDLQTWVAAKSLVVRIYAATAKFPKEEVYGLTSQLRRAAVSLPSNIAEGCGRGTYRGAIPFLFIARGSLYEIETQCVIAAELKYLSQQDYNDIQRQIASCKKLLNGLIKYFETKAAQPSNTARRSNQ